MIITYESPKAKLYTKKIVTNSVQFIAPTPAWLHAPCLFRGQPYPKLFLGFAWTRNPLLVSQTIWPTWKRAR
jgi:hypothetical protein